MFPIKDVITLLPANNSLAVLTPAITSSRVPPTSLTSTVPFTKELINIDAKHNLV